MRVAIIYHRIDWEVASRVRDYARQFGIEPVLADDEGRRLEGARVSYSELGERIATCGAAIVLFARTIDRIDLEIEEQIQACRNAGVPAVILVAKGADVTACPHLRGLPGIPLDSAKYTQALLAARNELGGVIEHKTGVPDNPDSPFWNFVLGVVVWLSSG